MNRQGVPTPPQISVLLPVRDAARTLPACLRSLERQTFTDWECVVVDDGSRDASAHVLAEAARRDPRIRVVAGRPAGLVAALESGTRMCRAPFVARMDADDLMHRERLAAQHAAFEARPSLAAVGTHVRLFPRSGLRDGLRQYESWLNSMHGPSDVRRDAFVECPIAHPTWMIRTGRLRELGYRDRGWPEDYDLLLRLLARGEEIGVVPRRLLGWRDTPERLSRTAPEYAAARFTACKAAFLARGLLASSPRYVLWGYGETGRTLRRALAEHDRTPSHIVELHPGRLGQRIHDAEVIPPQALRALPPTPIVVSVAGLVARTRIRHALDEMGFRELDDFVCAA